MANDTSKLTINNKTYDIKDANARCSKYQYTLNKNNWSNNTYALSVSSNNIDCKCYNTIELSDFDINRWKIYGITIDSTEKTYDGTTDTTTLATIYFKCNETPTTNITFTIVSFPSKTSVDGDLVNPYEGELVAPITTTATGSDLTLSTSAGNLNALTVYGKSEVVDGEIKSAGEGWATEDLGTPTWTYYGNGEFYSNPVPTIKVPQLNAKTILCDKYKTAPTEKTTTQLINKSIMLGTNQRIYIKDTDYTDATTFKNSLNGVLLCYQLDDPTQGNCIAVKTDNGTGINGTMAVFETGTPLRGITGGSRDVMTWDGSAGTVTKNCAKVRLADLTWSENQEYLGGFTAPIPNALPGLGNYISNYSYNTSTAFAWSKFNNLDEHTIYRTTYNSNIYIKATDYTRDLTGFVASLGDAELVYQLATPTTEQLTTTENASIAGLRTFAPQTHTQNNAQTEMTVEAYAGTENGKAVNAIDMNKETKSVTLSYADYIALPTKDPETSYYVPDAPDTWIFGYDLDKDDENPFTRVSYPADVDNTFYTPAFMDYTNDVFNYGSWNFKPGDKFMPNPCMLLYNGTVDYYLDPDDNAKKVDGTASDVADTSYGGNAMMEWGLLYTKRWEENGVYKFRVSNVRIDADWECWCNYDINNNVIPHFYTPIYFGSYDGTRMRSLSGQSNMVSTTRQQEIDRAKANGDGWFTEVYSDSLLFQDLCIMMSKCTDVQTAFGMGRVKSSNTSAIAPGTMNTKGMFWGSTDQTSGVKIFGMENPYGNIWRGKAGYMYINGVQTIKMTRGTYDGSTVTDYNITGSGYIAIPNSTVSAAGWQKYMIATPYGRFPKTVGGASNKYESDYVYVNNSGTFYLLFGGRWSNGLNAGFCVVLTNGAAYAYSNVGAALSCKPLA